MIAWPPVREKVVEGVLWGVYDDFRNVWTSERGRSYGDELMSEEFASDMYMLACVQVCMCVFLSTPVVCLFR